MRVFSVALLCILVVVIAAKKGTKAQKSENKVTVLEDLSMLNMTPRERTEHRRMIRQYKESEAEAKKEKKRDILDDWQKNKTGFWQTATEYDEECEACQFILFDIDQRFQNFKKNILAHHERKKDNPSKEHLAQVWSEGAFEILKNICSWDNFKSYGKIAGIDSRAVARKWCGPFITQYAEIIFTTMKEGRDEKILRKRVCKRDYCLQQTLDNKLKTQGFWTRLMHYPTSSLRHNTPWMRRERQGQRFLDSMEKDPKVQKHPKGAYLYRVVEEGPRPKTERIMQAGDKIRHHFWMKLMYSGGEVMFDSYKTNEPHISDHPVFHFTGINEAFSKMVVGDNRVFYIPSEHCYGTDGFGIQHPPNVVMMLQIHILGINEDTVEEDKKVYERHPDFYKEWNFAKKGKKDKKVKGRKRKKVQNTAKVVREMKNEL